MPAPPSSAKASADYGLLRAGSVVGGFTVLVRVLGLLRDIVIANVFGTSAQLDAFLVALRIPNLPRRLFAEGAFLQCFVPVLSEYHARRSLSEVRQLVARVAGSLTAVLLPITLLAMLGAHWLGFLFAPGLAAQAEAGHALVTQMLRITMPYLPLISLVALCAGVFNVYGRFALAAVTPAWFNISLILAALGLAPLLETPVMALAWGVLAAGVMQLLFQMPLMMRLGMLRLPVVAPQDTGVRRIARLMLPVMFGASVTQINLLVSTMLASFLVAGSISWLYYADRLVSLPVGIFAYALAAVLLPRLSHSHAHSDSRTFSVTIDQVLRLSLLLIAPATLAMYMLSVPLVATLFDHGSMRHDDVLAVAAALQALVLTMPGVAAIRVLSPAFFARQDTRTPVRVGIISVLVNLVFSLLLIESLAHVGLALATSIAALTQGGLLLYYLWRRQIWHPHPGWVTFGARLLLACVALACALYWLVPVAGDWLSAGLWQRVLWMGAVVTGGLLLYCLTLILLGYTPQRMLREFRRIL